MIKYEYTITCTLLKRNDEVEYINKFKREAYTKKQFEWLLKKQYGEGRIVDVRLYQTSIIQTIPNILEEQVAMW